MPVSFAGALVDLSLRVIPVGRSTNITAGVATTALSASKSSPEIFGPVTQHGPAATPTPRTGIAGVLEENFGALLFERIIILPSLKDLHFVLSATRFPLEIWNTFRTASQVLTAINITGSGGLTLDAPVTLPHTLLSMASVIYQATMPNSGSAAINQSVAFVVTGIGSPVSLATGTRILVFSVRPDWAQGLTEKVSDFTDVMASYSNKEQRRGLRNDSRRGVKFQADAMSARDAAGMESLIFGWQDKPYGVPFWQDLVLLQADAVSGDVTIAIETADRLFAPGGLLLFYLDEFNVEALTILAVTAHAVTLESPLINSWKKGSLVMPVFLARIADTVTVGRLSSAIDQIEADFDGEAGQLSAVPAVAFTQFKGFAVLEVPPNRESDLKREYKRALVRLDQQTGPITVESKTTAPLVTHDFPWFINARPDVTRCRAFLRDRSGQLNPFWVPTWDRDLVMSADIAPAGTALNIKRVYYTRFFFPEPARRFVTFIGPGGVIIGHNKILAAVENSDDTETLTLETPMPDGVAAASTMVSFLTFSRLAADDNAIEWSNTSLAEATLTILELPQEVPA